MRVEAEERPMEGTGEDYLTGVVGDRRGEEGERRREGPAGLVRPKLPLTDGSVPIDDNGPWRIAHLRRVEANAKPDGRRT